METNSKAQLLAEAIKMIVLAEKPAKDETNDVLASILGRLERIEAELAIGKTNFVSVKTPLHPSQEKFNIVEAAEVLLPGTNDKACRFELDKPCDYCSMCSAHGF